MPSQFMIHRQRLEALLRAFSEDKLSPIPVKAMGHRYVMTDGHHRAAALLQLGWQQLPVVMDEDELDMQLYQRCVDVCVQRGIHDARGLLQAVVEEEAWQEWIRFCDRIQAEAGEKP